MMDADEDLHTSHHDHHTHHEEDFHDAAPDLDFMDSEPSAKEQMQMRKANKRPSDWLRFLCRDWAMENQDLVVHTDAKFMEYKPYLKGILSSQLLCRLSIPQPAEKMYTDFWGILGIQDEFDKAYIVAQIERFCSLYNIRAGTMFYEDHTVTAPTVAATAAATVDHSFLDDHAATAAAAAAAAANAMPFMNDATAAAVAAAQDAAKGLKKDQHLSPDKHNLHHRISMPKEGDHSVNNERRQTLKREQRRLSQERKELKAREREQVAERKAAERLAREQSREVRRRKKLEIRQQREHFAQQQKEAALKRAAELVASNRVPIEITRGAAAAKAAAHAALQQSGAIITAPVAPAPQPAEEPPKKRRSAIVVSTARDLHQIVTHSKNLWAKYNAIAKEHNQKVNWITVAKELGIHVKVREKYARMHSRACQRGFDWDSCGHYKIKDHPEVFQEPTESEQKAKMPPPLPSDGIVVASGSTASTASQLSDAGEHHDQQLEEHHCNEEAQHSHDHHKSSEVPVDEAAVAAAAAVVDAAGVSGAVEDGTAAAVAAAMDHDSSEHVHV